MVGSSSILELGSWALDHRREPLLRNGVSLFSSANTWFISFHFIHRFFINAAIRAARIVTSVCSPFYLASQPTQRRIERTNDVGRR